MYDIRSLRSALIVMVLALMTIPAESANVMLTYQDGVDGYTGTRDTVITGLHPAGSGELQQNGATTSLWIKYQSLPPNYISSRAVIKFTSLNLPPGASNPSLITSVRLRLHVKVNAGEGGNVSAYGLLKDFTEGTGTGQDSVAGANWRYANYSTYSWTSYGADTTGTVYDGAFDRLATADDTINISSPSGTFEGWVEWNVTASFRDQLANGREYGWVLVGPSSGFVNINTIKSRNYTTDTALRPQLVISYNDSGCEELPESITYQGKLTDQGGNPIYDGQHNARFDFFTVETGGSALWSSPPRTITTSAGIFTTRIESIPANVFAGPTLWIESVVNGETIAPRVKVTSVPYAFRALSARGLSSESTVEAKVGGAVALSLTPGGIFTANATGGATFNSGAGAGVNLPAGGGSWSSLSDRNAKTNISAVNQNEILEKLSGLEMGTWSYKAQDSSIRHIGPMAQDFYSAFGLGEDSRHISTVDADGVALAAIQGLYKIVLQKDSEIAELKETVEALRIELNQMRQAGGKR